MINARKRRVRPSGGRHHRRRLRPPANIKPCRVAPSPDHRTAHTANPLLTTLSNVRSVYTPRVNCVCVPFFCAFEDPEGGRCFVCRHYATGTTGPILMILELVSMCFNFLNYICAPSLWFIYRVRLYTKQANQKRSTTPVGGVYALYLPLPFSYHSRAGL